MSTDDWMAVIGSILMFLFVVGCALLPIVGVVWILFHW